MGEALRTDMRLKGGGEAVGAGVLEVEDGGGEGQPPEGGEGLDAVGAERVRVGRRRRVRVEIENCILKIEAER